VQRPRRAGVESLLESDIPAVAAASPDGSFATADLYHSIESGAYPEWQLWMQTMAPADADKLDFDPLDATKARPRPCGLPRGPASRACPRMSCTAGPCSGSRCRRLRQPGPLGASPHVKEYLGLQRRAPTSQGVVIEKPCVRACLRQGATAGPVPRLHSPSRREPARRPRADVAGGTVPARARGLHGPEPEPRQLLQRQRAAGAVAGPCRARRPHPCRPSAMCCFPLYVLDSMRSNSQ
jgi:hypothetical protein